MAQKVPWSQSLARPSQRAGAGGGGKKRCPVVLYWQNPRMVNYQDRLGTNVGEAALKQRPSSVSVLCSATRYSLDLLNFMRCAKRII